jgi:prophage antirepressor-like protein
MKTEQETTEGTEALATFTFGEQEIRVAGTKEVPFFCVADVCACLELGLAGDAVRNHPEDEKGMETFHTPGGGQKMLAVTEPGLYRLIFRSYKPKAEEFRKWVFRDVLPSLRHTGQYAMPGRGGEALDIEGRVTTFIRVTECLVKLGAKPVAAGNAALRWLPVITSGMLLPSCEEKAREETEQLFTAIIERSDTAFIMVKLPELIVVANELGLLQEHTRGAEKSIRTRMGMCLRHMRGVVLETARGQWQVTQRGTASRSEWILRRTREVAA